MSRRSGRYCLIREDLDNDKIEFFDLETMSFVKNNTKGIDLPCIDVMTTSFDGPAHFTSYIDETKQSQHSYTYKIIYKALKKKESVILPVVWDDIPLNSFSKLSDGKVDFVQDYNYDNFFRIIDEVRDPKNGLARKIATAKKASLKMCKDNRKAIEALASSDKETPYRELMLAFSNYRECRALYLNYKEYKEQQIQKTAQCVSDCISGGHESLGHFQYQLAKIMERISTGPD